MALLPLGCRGPGERQALAQLLGTLIFCVSW